MSASSEKQVTPESVKRPTESENYQTKTGSDYDIGEENLKHAQQTLERSLAAVNLTPKWASATSAKITPDQEDETVRRRKIVDALHAFNEVKDSALAIFHALAELRQTSMAALFSEFQVDREGDD